MVIEHLAYNMMEERFDRSIYTENQTKQDFTKAGEKLTKHIYFVAETKGSLTSMQLKGAEQAKIGCARKFSASLVQNDDYGITYDVVAPSGSDSAYSVLMQLVGSPGWPSSVWCIAIRNGSWNTQPSPSLVGQMGYCDEPHWGVVQECHPCFEAEGCEIGNVPLSRTKSVGRSMRVGPPTPLIACNSAGLARHEPRLCTDCARVAPSTIEATCSAASRCRVPVTCEYVSSVIAIVA